MDRSETRLVLRAAAIAAVSVSTPYALAGLVAPIADATGWARSDLGLTAGIGLAAATVSAPIAGALLDRTGRAGLLLAVAGALVAAGLAGAALAPSALVLSLVAGTLCGGGCGILAVAAFAPLAALPAAGRAYGIAFAGGGAGTAVALPAAGLLAGLVGWRTALLALAGVVAAAVGALARIPAPRPLAAASRTAAARMPRRRLAAYLGAVALFAFADETGFVHLASHAAAAGLGEGAARLLGSFLAAGFAAGVYAGGELSDRLGRLPVLAGCGVVVAAALAVLAAPAQPFLAAPVLGIALGGAVAARWAWSSDAFPRGASGRIAGLSQVAYAAGGAPVGWLGGRVFEATGGYAPLFAVAAAVALAFTALVVCLVSPEARAGAAGAACRLVRADRWPTDERARARAIARHTLG